MSDHVRIAYLFFFFYSQAFKRTVEAKRNLTHRKSIKSIELILFFVGRPNLGLPVYFFSNVRHAQWAIPQTLNEGSVFIEVIMFFPLFSPECLRDGGHGYKNDRRELRC